MSESNAAPDAAAPAARTDASAAWTQRMQLGFGGLVALTFGLIVLGALVRAHDAGLGDRDRLLLHRLEQRVVLVAHLVELVDAAPVDIQTRKKRTLDLHAFNYKSLFP